MKQLYLPRFDMDLAVQSANEALSLQVLKVALIGDQIQRSANKVYFQKAEIALKGFD